MKYGLSQQSDQEALERSVATKIDENSLKFAACYEALVTCIVGAAELSLLDAWLDDLSKVVR
jgi:hypothetical protein